MSGQLSLMSDQVTVWSDKVQAAMLKLFSSLDSGLDGHHVFPMVSTFSVLAALLTPYVYARTVGSVLIA